MSLRIRDIMTRLVEVVPPEMSVREVAALMRERNVGVYPVCEDKSLLGIVTDRDLALRVLAEGKDPDTTRISEVMSTNLAWCSPETRVDEVLPLMARRQIRRIPVLSPDGGLMGMVTLGKVAESDCEASGEVLKEILQPGIHEPRC
ncbi:MAG TPA: CBS domain-containing protein [Planctomycetota bacterium]|nr:CBS domain-containing protein [Planctomycetota bacterium]